MSCDHCKSSVTEALSGIDGIKEVTVDLDTGIAEYTETEPVDKDTLKQAIEKIGFEFGG